MAYKTPFKSQLLSPYTLLHVTKPAKKSS